MRAKSLLLLMLALGCGLVASIGITQVMAKRDSKTVVTTGEMDTIFVAMEDIPMGDPITAQMIKLEEWPKGRIPPEALTKIKDVERRRPKTKIYKGSPILDNQLLDKDESERGATTHIPKGYRVVSVKVDNVSGGGSMILPGDRVDVLVHLRKSQDVDITTTRTILQDVKVFAVNDVFDLDSTDGNSRLAAQTISLVVTPEDAEKLTLASELGKVRLVMRSPEDDGEVITQGAEINELFGIAGSSDRSSEASPPPPVEPQKDAADAADFVQWLNSQQAAVPAEVEKPPATDNWRMRVISAGEVSEVMLASESEPSSPEAPATGGFSLWKMISSARWGSGTAGTQAAQGDQTPPTEEGRLEPEQDAPEPEEVEEEAEEPLENE